MNNYRKKKRLTDYQNVLTKYRQTYFEDFIKVSGLNYQKFKFLYLAQNWF